MDEVHVIKRLTSRIQALGYKVEVQKLPIARYLILKLILGSNKKYVIVHEGQFSGFGKIPLVLKGSELFLPSG